MARRGLILRRYLYDATGPNKRLRLLNLFISSMRLPLIRGAYDKLYSPVIRRAILKLPSRIQIETTSKCNLRCIMCPSPLMSRSRTQMDTGLFRKIIDDAPNFGIQEVSLTGFGEPLLDDLLFERIAYAKSKGMRVDFASNATLLTSDMAEKIVASSADQVVFSIDGATEETYETIRRGAKFSRVVQQINYLVKRVKGGRDRFPEITVTCSLQRANVDELKKEASTFVSLFRKGTKIEFGLVDSWWEPEANHSLKLGSKLPPKYPCFKIWQTLMVLSNGDLVLCCRDYEGVTKLGNLAEHSIGEIWHSAKFAEMRTLHAAGRGKEIDICRNCEELWKAWLYWWSK